MRKQMKLTTLALVVSSIFGRYWPAAADEEKRYTLYESDLASLKCYFNADIRYDTFYEGEFPYVGLKSETYGIKFHSFASYTLESEAI